MATIRITSQAAAALTVYAVVFRLSDGKVFDWSDNTWKVIGSAVTPAVAMTNLATFATTEGDFAADLNLSTINATMAGVDVSIKIFSQAGGSPAPATDTYLGHIDPFTVVIGQRLSGVSSFPKFTAVCVVDTTTSLGTAAHVKVVLLDEAGQLLDLNTLDPAATCAVEVIRDGGAAQFTLSTINFGAPSASGWFEATQANPNFTTDVGYTAKATIVSGGNTYTGPELFFVAP